jgi:hypothetical protein
MYSQHAHDAPPVPRNARVNPTSRNHCNTLLFIAPTKAASIARVGGAENRCEKIRMAEVLFEGTKTFWKTKNSVNLTIVEHHGHDVIEVVAYEPTLQVEAPRLYLEIGRIIPFLEQEMDLLEENEAALASATSNFVFNRLRISKYLPVSRVVKMEVQRGFGAREQDVDFQVAVDRPADLVPYSVSRSTR